MSLRATRTVELRSIVGAAGVSSNLFQCAGSKINVHVITAPANLVRIRGAANSNPAEVNDLTMIDAAGGGYAAAATLGAGNYVIVDKPNWIEVHITQDAGGPRTFRVELQFDPEE